MNATSWVVEKMLEFFGVKQQHELLDALHIDTLDTRGLDLRKGIMPIFKGPKHPLLTEKWGGNILELWGVEEQVMSTPDGRMFGQTEYPLQAAQSLEDLQRYQWPDPDWFDYSTMRSRLLEHKDRSIIVTGGSVWQHPSYVRGLDTLMMDMLAEPKMASYLFDVFTEFYLGFFTRILDEAGDLIDSIALADDLGMQNSLMISPALFDTFVAPNIKKVADLAHSYDCALILHSDGNIRSIIPNLISLGVDVLDPMQPEAVGMDMVEIKREFGKDLVFRGGISTQQTLAYGNKQDVAEEVKRVIDILGKDGGYICSPGHPVLQEDVPIDNIIAMYETAHEYGKY
ncbi:MAG: uroporphyrinogen decarboxylase family protein [Sphaerochaeta sp.]|nr:uroporphyrinogen decarboxylase family protein [Sphaerochaeta sp.]